MASAAYMSCPVCIDDASVPVDRGTQVAWLRAQATAVGRIADRVEAGEDYEVARSHEALPCDSADDFAAPIQQLRCYEATFQPKRTDDLKPGLEAFIGRRYTWQASWICEEGEPFAGQWAMAVDFNSDFPHGWVPEEDLADIEPANPFDVT